MATKIPIKLVDLGSGQGSLKEFEAGDTLPAAVMPNTDSISEGATNLYFTQPRVRTTPLTGLSVTNSAIVAGDTVLAGLGKAQGQLNALGTASTGTLTTSTTDSTIGRVLKVGDFGLGAALIGTSTDLNTYLASGSYITPASGVTNLPHDWSQGRAILTVDGGPSYAQQVISRDGYFASRWWNGSVWGTWYWDYSERTAVGTVSQSGGVPTGSILESGSNANGYYEKFADGTMICLRTDSYPTLDVNITSGAMFRSAAITPVSWPVSFVGIPRTVVASASSSGVGWISKGGPASASNTPIVYEMELLSATRSVSIEYIGFGRWF